ncbi:hypothetical protein CDN99_05625 [Roseateles aquatilis]|uniref:STAS domain-containing protein n=1 Tax=Roseateles aquatilis TaxID=431061 RepID=A0A246JGX7_9BURK|nr:SulP family inorganic anion transporter [Roseateles aquatilis]OWQ91851.1 hypothetical protein CDN99_05625 [Roseateles aquatilis]
MFDGQDPAPGTSAALWRDLGAGLCIAGLLLPEAVAYAGLARVPVTQALTAAMAGLALYAVFGRSRFAIVAPTSSTASLAAAAVLSVGGPVPYGEAFLALVLLAGLMMLALGYARQGALSGFVSRPVLRGFAFALAITIVIKQLPDALGLVLPPGTGGDPLHVLLYALSHPTAWHLPSLAVALLAGAVVTVLRRWPQVPAAMLVIVLAIVAAWQLGITTRFGVAEVGAFQRPGLHLSLPRLPLSEWLRLAELAFGLVVLVIAESWGSMRSLALARGDTLDPNRELMALGACNVAAGLLQGMPVGAGFSATSANAAAGAVSRLAGVVALIVITLALVLALPALHLLPRPVLAVAVISALWHALNPRPLLDLWRMNRDRALLVAAVAAVLVLGVLYGMLVAIALSVVGALRRFSQPVVHELGELGDTRNFVMLDEHHPGATGLPGLLILRPEEPLFFASADRVAAEVRRRVEGHAALNVLVLSLEESADLDSTAVECLLELDRWLAARGVRLVLSRVKEPVRALLAGWDPHGLGDEDRLFWSVADAARQAPKSA